MSIAYSEIPPGGQVNIPPAIPTGMLYRVKNIAGVSKQTVKIVPISGQTTVTQGQKIIVTLPPNAIVDLSTFEMNYTGATQHGGNGVDWATTGGTSTNIRNYCGKRYFPRNSASIIQNLEVKINGQSRQNIPEYNYIYNILNDYTCGTDCTSKNRIGMNADPSNKSTYVNGRTQTYRGFPVGCTDQSTDNSFLDQDNYTIRNWLGFLGGNASTNIIDTSLYGDVTIELTLAPSGILMLSPPIGAQASYATATNTELNLSTSAGGAPLALASQGTGYNISNIGFQITRYDMPDSYNQAVASVLQSGAVFKLFYPNYSVFYGNSVTMPRGGTTRFNISTQSLDMVITTFQPQDRDVQQAPILGPQNANGWGSLNTEGSVVGISNTAGGAGEYGSQFKTFNYALQLGVAKTLNNSKYFVRNGDGIDRGTYIVGAVRLIPETIPEQFNGVLRAFNAQNDTLGGLYPGILSLSHYQTQFYSHILSLNVTSEHEMYTVSGLNCSATPISIQHEFTAASSIANVEQQATSNGNIWRTGNTNSTPVCIACYTSRIEVAAGRNIIMFN
jgi:hypothetical protein